MSSSTMESIGVTFTSATSSNRAACAFVTAWVLLASAGGCAKRSEGALGAPASEKGVPRSGLENSANHDSRVDEETHGAARSNPDVPSGVPREHCPNESPRECFDRAVAIAATDPDGSAESMVLSMMFEACENGYAEACSRFAQVRGVSSPVEAFEAYLRACDLGDQSSCWKAGAMLVVGRDGIDQDRKRGFQLLAQSCDAGECAACLKLAEYYRKGKFVPADPRSVEEYERLGAPCRP